ncbi:MAG TPA: ABC transporter permease [Acidimicrobiales bacterium]|nr:ABC transporter permease [Acidimicrobiales bacterium]
MFLILGLGSGAIYSAVGLGVVVTYRASGVVNFAQGAMALYLTYVFVWLRDTGDLVLPVGTIHLAATFGLYPALALALVLAAVLGLLSYVLIFRPLRRAPQLAKIVASVGLMIAFEATTVLRFGTGSLIVPPVLPATPIKVLGLEMPRDRLILAAVVALAALVLWALYRFTRFGLLTRASAENERGVLSLGSSPDRIAALNWVLAAVVAALVGILVGPITDLDPEVFTLIIVPALGAALLGGLRSYGWTVAGGMLIGMLQSEALKFQISFSWFPKEDVGSALPFVIIIAVLLIRGRRLPTRGEFTTQTLPPAPPARRPLVSAAVLSAITIVLLFTLHTLNRVSLINSMGGALVCLSFVLVTGYVGQISLAQMAFAGTAGFMLGPLATRLHIPFPIAPLLAAIVAALVGALVGAGAVRLRGIQLAVATIGFSVAISSMWFEAPNLTGGFSGTNIPQPSLFGVNLGISGSSSSAYPRAAFGMLMLAVLVLVALGVANLRRSPTGRRLLAVRANERAAAAGGVNVTATKLLAFAASAFIAGLGGALLGYQQGNLSYPSFDVFVSLSFLAFAYLGGITTIAGALVGGSLVAGGLVFTVLNQWIPGINQYQLLIGGLGLILTAVLNPVGIAGGTAYMASMLAAKLRAVRSPAALAVPATPGLEVSEASGDGPPELVHG